jgi:uncharacterized protein (DUF697 family)
MAKLKDLSNAWNNIKEIDLRPLAREAGRDFLAAVVGRPELGAALLAERLRRDPHRPEIMVDTPVLVAEPASAPDPARVDLFILLVEASTADDSAERSLAQAWAAAKKPVLVVLTQPGESQAGLKPPGMAHWSDWGSRRVVVGDPDDEKFLLRRFTPALLKLLPDQLLTLGRNLPLARVAVAHQLINDACFANAAYSLSTGLAEIVPVFDVPLNITDMLVLTKAQAFLVYKLGLALGLSTQWQDYVTEFGGVLGGGFLWRQLARQLVGLIPVWGLAPKVAVSYAGTYVVGHVVLQWYLTGRQLTRQQMRQLYGQAFAHGKQLAEKLFKDRLPRRKKRPELPAAIPGRLCPACSRMSAEDAQFCQYCGETLKVSRGDPAGS